MNRLFIILSLWLVQVPVFSQQGDLKIMTFNIRYDNPDDGPFSWDKRRPMVRQLMETEKPDIACFQEVLYGQLMALRLMLPGYGYTGVAREDGKTKGEYTPILFDTTRFQVISERTTWLSEKPDAPGSKSWGAACTRIVTRLFLFDRRWKDTIVIYNTHFDHVSVLAREKSAGMIAGNISELAGEPFVVVTGDFNDTLNSSALRMITKGGLKPAVQAGMHSPDGPDYTYIGFPYTPRPGEMIDHIFIHTNRTDPVKESYINTFNYKGYYPSDHLPVIAVFRQP